MRSQVQKGTVKVGYTRTSDSRLFCSPSSETRRENGMKSRVEGTRYVRKIPMLSRSPHRPVSRARL